jgi:putative transposase
MDFMTDSLYHGRRFRLLTIVDHVTRESPALAVDYSFSGQQVAAVLERVAQSYGLPKVIFVGNGPEFISKALDVWAHRKGVKLVFSRPGTPTDTPCIEAFNGRFRQECLDQHWFTSLNDSRTTIETWRVKYNTVRPHTVLQNQTPAEYKATLLRSHQLAETD